ncbi:unnamed protein product [Parajaminaea phylloscopi]
MTSFDNQDFDFSAFLNSPAPADSVLEYSTRPDLPIDNDVNDAFAMPPSVDSSLLKTMDGPNSIADHDVPSHFASMSDALAAVPAQYQDEATRAVADNAGDGVFDERASAKQWQQPSQAFAQAPFQQQQPSSYEQDTVTARQATQSQPPLPTPLPLSTVSTPSSQQISDGATSYSARIAAHHSHLLRSVLPTTSAAHLNAIGRSLPASHASLGLPGQRSLGGSVSSSAVPLSQSVQRALTSTGATITLQERRRNSRRAQQAHTKAAPIAPRSFPASGGRMEDASTADRNAYGPTTKPNAIRAMKRGMSTSSGRIHSPQTTANARQGLDVVPSHDSIPNKSRRAQPAGIDGPAALVRRADEQMAQPAAASRQAYSSSGFDLLGALARVVLRPNPRISLGPVDLSCSFTVCDARHPEQPIIYCSDTFCKLTGYSRNEILGRNCRFLQSPDGRVQRGTERFHTDNAAVAHMKQHAHAAQECQASLINYRKNGSPFINLVTIVPIGWGDSVDPVYLVGFQVDLVEQPSAVLERSQDGSYVVNYSTGGGAGISLPAAAAEHLLPGITRDLDQEAAAREVSIGKELTSILAGGKEDSSQWARIMLQHSHDLIHVLSLKGTFLHVSPSVERLLGFKPEELIGKSISDFCHPSDVVPVFRELKDSTSNASINAAAKRSFRTDGIANRATKGGVGQGGPEVNLLMRMRHKTRGHVWIESKGKLHLEQGKGRKVVISSGRPRAVYNLPWEPVKNTLSSSSGAIAGIDKPHFWAKVSNDGLVLSATDGVSAVIDGTEQASLFGKHLTQMVNTEAMPALLEGLRGINISTVTHQMWNAIDEPVWVTSTLFPSAVMPGAHVIPTVFVHVSLAVLDSAETSVLNPNTVIEQQGVDLGADKPPADGTDGGVVPGSSVFGELSTQRSTSHIFELHSLKHVNRRLREEVRSAQRRVGQAVGVKGQMPTASMNSVPIAAAPPAPLKEDFVNALNERTHSQGRLAPASRQASMFSSAATRGNSSAGVSSSGAEVTSGSGNGGSASDSTAPTTAVSSGNNSDEMADDSDAGKAKRAQMV